MKGSVGQVKLRLTKPPLQQCRQKQREEAAAMCFTSPKGERSGGSSIDEKIVKEPRKKNKGLSITDL